jgi:hypothetical protein
MMKKLILAFGVLGVVAMFIPMGGGMPSMFSMLKAFAMGQLVIMLVAFALPAAMGAMAMSKPPLQKWQAGVALAGFGLAAWKLQIWTWLSHIGEAVKSIPTLLFMVAVIGGVIASIMALVKSEETA